MKKLLAILSLFLLSCAGAYSASLQQAEDAYREGRFAAALAQYEELLQAYPNNPYLYYNIGNCYFKMGTKGLAVANYYRAFRLDPRDKDIRHNLNLALQNSGESFVTKGMPVVLHQAFFYFTLAELKGLFFITLCLFCMIGSLCAFRRKWGFSLWASLLLVCFCGAWYMGRAKLDAEPLAVVAAPVAELRSGPGKNFPASANVAQGHLVLLQDSRDNWQEVIIKSQGVTGWIESNFLEKI